MHQPPADRASSPSEATVKALSIASADRTEAMLTQGMIQGFDLIPGSVIVADAEGTIRYVNPYGMKVSGYNAAEMTGRPLATFWEQCREASDKIFSHLKRHRYWQGEIKQKTRDGAGHWQTVSLSLVPGADARSTVIIQIAQPLPAEKEKKLRELKSRCEAIEKEAERYRIILNASPDPICLTRVEDGKYVFVNDTFYERTGFTPEQVAKHTSLELNVYTDPDDRNRMLHRLKRDGRVENMEMTIRSRDGSIISNLWSLRIIEYEGEPHLLLISRNYSELRAAQQALVESEEGYRRILDSAPYSIIVARLSDSRYMQVNEAFCRRTGYSREEAVGHTPYEIGIWVDPTARERMLEMFNRDGFVDSMELQFRAKNGTILDSLFSVTPITYRGEACLLAMTVDIGELKATQRALKESEERYRSILRNIKEGYWETDLKGTYTFVNEAECIMHRRTKQQMVGTRGEEISLPESYKAIASIFNRVYKTGMTSPLYELEVVRGDGLIVTIESSASLLKDATGQPKGFFGISRDITEKRKAEIELERYRLKLEQMVQDRTRALEEAQDELVKREKLAVLGQLTATVSHELRNPLGVIRFSNFYLQRNVEAQSDKMAKHFVRIEEQVALCDRIVADLLEYTRGRPLSAQSELLQPWLGKLIDQIEETQSIVITRHLPDDLPPIRHDREKMRRVFINLIENAVQAIEDRNASNNGPPGKYEPRISVEARCKDGQLVMKVSDNGVGMDKNIREKAFDPLFTTRARGTGIGLANVQRIINDHGGNVSLISEPGQGSTVTITLPYPDGLKTS